MDTGAPGPQEMDLCCLSHLGMMLVSSIPQYWSKVQVFPGRQRWSQVLVNANLPNAVLGGTSPVRTLSVTSFVFLLVSALNAMCPESGRKQCAKLHS
jgi:hypothetical protein